MASFKEQLKDKVNWKQVDLVMGKNLVSPVANPKGNGWKTKNSISISVDGLNATNTNNTTGCGWRSVSAEKGFSISVDFSGPVMYYFEVTITCMSSLHRRIIVGLSSGNVPNGYLIGGLSNSYAIIDGCDYCWLSGYKHDFEWPNGATKQKWNGPGDVVGCGLLMTHGNGVSIFFTGNGLLMGTQIPISTSMDTLYPTVSMDGSASVEANFGDDSAKPFKYDIKKCPGIVFK